MQTNMQTSMQTRSKKSCTCANCLKVMLPEDRYIICSKCKKAFHTDICIGGNEPSEIERKTWACPKCQAEKKKTVSISSKTASGATQLSSDASTVSDTSINTSQANQSSSSSELQKLTREISCLRKEMTEFKRNMETMFTTTVNKLDERIEVLLTKVTDNEYKITAFETENEQLKLTIANLEERQRAQEQAGLRNEIEVIGLPETSTENLHHAIMVVAKKIDVEVKNEDIDWIERVGPRRSTSSSGQDPKESLSRPIVIRFIRRAKRDEFLKASKSRKPITASDLGVNLSAQSGKIFFNERLTRGNRQLFRETRRRAAEAGFKYCWTSNGHIHIRKKEGSPAIHIRNTNELLDKMGTATLP